MKFCVYFGGPVLFFFCDKVTNWMVGVQELLGKLGAAVQMSVCRTIILCDQYRLPLPFLHRACGRSFGWTIFVLDHKVA
jgi:hypothetical protein